MDKVIDFVKFSLFELCVFQSSSSCPKSFYSAPEFSYLTIIFRDGNGGLELVSTCLGAQRDLEV